jgi:flagellar M-ring protein FliF
MQVAGIVHLVSSSVPQLVPSNVSVIDQDGNLITQTPDPLKNAGLDPGQLKYVKEIEAQYLKRVEAILAPIVGKSNFRAQVAAEVDFSQIDQVAETYKPNPAAETAIRSQQTSESNQGGAQAMGVPGALTNQPPVPATAPITNPQVGAGAGGAGQGGNFTRNATINYEVDKTVRHTRGVPGVVRRLSVAVAVNHKPGPEVKGKPGAMQPPSADELKRINDLVREAVGFNQSRGDSISVAAASFVPPEPDLVPELPIWKDPEMIALGKELGKYLVFALIAFLIWRKLLQPIFEMIAATAHRVEAEEEKAAEEALEGLGEEGPREPTFEELLEEARGVAHNDPKLIAELIKEWLGASGT